MIQMNNQGMLMDLMVVVTRDFNRINIPKILAVKSVLAVRSVLERDRDINMNFRSVRGIFKIVCKLLRKPAS